MKLSHVRNFIFSLFLVERSWSFSEKEQEVVEYFGNYFNSQYYIFVDSGKGSDMLKRVRDLSRGNMFSSVMSPSLLENILKDTAVQLRFFQKKTMLVTKEILNLNLIFNKTLTSHLVSWMVFGNYSQQLHPLYIPMSIDVFFVHSSQSQFTVEQVYHVKPELGETVITVWKWDSNKTPKPFPVIQNHKSDFYNVTMNMHYLFHKNVCQDIHGKLMRIKIECHHQNILELIGTKLNFSLNGVECMEKIYPFSYPNGSDSELFIKLKSREVDFSVVSHVVRKSNLASLNLVWPTFVLKSMMYLKRSRLAGHWTSYLRPLDTSIWLGLLTWIILTGLLLLVFEKLLINQLKFQISTIVEFFNYVLRALQVFCSQAVIDIPTAISIRMLYFLKLCVFVIFFQAYCGYLVSSLMVVVPHFPFTDLEEFFENKKYQLMTIRYGFERFYYRHIVGEGRRQDFMLPDEELPRNVQEGVNKLCSASYLAFVDFRQNLLDIDKIKCKITELPRPISNIYMAIASPRTSPYTEYVMRELIYLESAGINKRMAFHLTSHPYFHDLKTQEAYITVSMEEVFSVFILLGMGICLSWIIFAIEWLLCKRKTSEMSAKLIKRSCRKINFENVQTEIFRRIRRKNTH